VVAAVREVEVFVSHPEEDLVVAMEVLQDLGEVHQDLEVEEEVAVRGL